MQRKNNAQKPRGSKAIRIDAENEIGPALNIGIAPVIDVPDIEVQVPSLSSPVWMSTSRGHERFANEIHRSSLRAKECKLDDVCLESSKLAMVNHGQGPQDSNNFKTKVEPSNIHRETFCLLDTGSPGLIEWQQRRQRRQQQSYVNTSKSKVHLREETDHQGGQNLDSDSRMPENAQGIPLKLASPSVKKMVRHHDPDERETEGARHSDGVLSVLGGKFRNQLEKEFTDDDWLHWLLSWKHQDKV